MPLFHKRYHAPGTAPGTITPAMPERLPDISMTEYSEREITERSLQRITDCVHAAAAPTVTWIHVQGAPTANLLHDLGDTLSLNILALEDIANAGQRPKIEEYDDHLFVILNQTQVDPDDKVDSQQISIFVSGSFVISFCAGDHDPFVPIRERLRQPASRLRHNDSSFLLHALLDVVVDSGFPLLEYFDGEIDRIEEAVLLMHTHDIMPQLHRIRRGLIVMRKNLWPQREILSRLLEGEHAQLDAGIHPFVRDCYDHTAQMIDVVENYREIVASMFEIHIANVSNRLNEIMRVLTVIATIFIPLTFIVGVYGMNFASENSAPWAMPELRWAYGYPAVWLVMILIAGAMLVFFRRRRWI